MASKKKIKTLSDAFNPHTTKETYHLKPHPETGRLIDNHPGKRTIPMRVLVLGMSRTGTMSIFSALEDLEYNVYHMSKAAQAPKSNLDVWREGLAAKFEGKGKKWGRTEFDKVLGNYDAVADVPCICFAEELIEAYPDAKVILNQRDVDQWLVSMGNTAGNVLSWSSWDWVSPWDPALAEPFWKFAKVVMPAAYHTISDFSPTSPARQAFLEHYERVKRLTPPDRLLEYRVQEGWGPFCKFLEVPVPDKEFPRVNDAKQFVIQHHIMWSLAFGKLLLKTSLVTVPVVAVSVALWRGQSINNLIRKFW